MSDDSDYGHDDEENPSRKKGVDFARLSGNLKSQRYSRGEKGQAVEKAIEKHQEHIKQRQRRWELGSLAAKLFEDEKSYSASREQMEKILEPHRGLQDRMKNLGLAAGEDSAIGRVAKQIADQQRAIEALRPPIPKNTEKLELPPNIEPPRLPPTHNNTKELELPLNIESHRLPRNPILETNEGLERIEERFEQIQCIATDAAQIANGLQGSAAEFLQKFEVAA